MTSDQHWHIAYYVIWKSTLHYVLNVRGYTSSVLKMDPLLRLEKEREPCVCKLHVAGENLFLELMLAHTSPYSIHKEFGFTLTRNWRFGNVGAKQHMIELYF